jgi:pyruvate,orthophosphate dikinase
MAAVAPAVTWSFLDAPGPDRNLLGGKGAGLVEMTRLGLPVPPGFIVGAPCGHEYLERGALPAALEDELARRIAELERGAGRRFGDDHAPLLVSVRSGAPVSMPGMMDTILNVGLTEAGARALADETGDERFAYSCLERLLHSFAVTVRGIPVADVEDALLDPPGGTGPRGSCEVLHDLIERLSGRPFPDAAGQLREAIAAVFCSWNSERAQTYRRHKGIDDMIGTAVVIQRMVFGNRGEDSASGVCFTRDPTTGAAGAYGDVLFDAQGEDVVAGERDPLPLEALAEQLPDAARALHEVCLALEREFRDVCDIEFTVEQGELWVLQTRVGQRSARAAVRIAVALAEEGLISREDAVERVSDEQLQAARAPVLVGAPPDGAVIGRGLPCSPGVGIGVAALTCLSAQRRHDGGESVVLVRPTTSPADLPGVLAASALVTARGGRVSHAAVVARGLNRPAVCGTGPLDVEEGEMLTVDGDRGLVIRGQVELVPAEADPAMAMFMQWSRAAAPAR